MAKFGAYKIALAQLTYRIYNQVLELSEDWDAVAAGNIFLSKGYLSVLEESAPENMTCHYIGIFETETLRGIAISQFIDLNQLSTLGDRDHGVKTTLRNWVFRNFSSHILFIGNNMLTGQNAFAFDRIGLSEGLATLAAAANGLSQQLQKQGTSVHLTIFKDFDSELATQFPSTIRSSYFKFSTQPNMVFTVRQNWQSFEDYIANLNKKYRDQYKRSQKKASGLIRRKMSLQDIIDNQEIIYDLYLHVARSAPFNTFFLQKNHFISLKRNLGERFKFYGYFDDASLIGFNTLIKNGGSLDTYFLGYDEGVQREKMLYLNMLYDMVGYGIKKQFRNIIFARTALEIKSSIGAQPEVAYGYMKHSNRFIQKYIAKIFNYLEPATSWHNRHPFND